MFILFRSGSVLNRGHHQLYLIIMSVFGTWLIGCQGLMSPIQLNNGRTQSQVDLVVIPNDPNLPNQVRAVKPFQTVAQSISSDNKRIPEATKKSPLCPDNHNKQRCDLPKKWQPKDHPIKRYGK